MEYDFDLSIFDEKETPKIKNTIKKIDFKDIIIFENDDYILINKPPVLSFLSYLLFYRAYQVPLDVKSPNFNLLILQRLRKFV